MTEYFSGMHETLGLTSSTEIFSVKNKNRSRAVVAHAFNPSTREAEAGESL